MEKDYIRATILLAIMFVALWRFRWNKHWVDKYDDYYYYYINQYPSMETINKVQDMSMPN